MGFEVYEGREDSRNGFHISHKTLNLSLNYHQINIVFVSLYEPRREETCLIGFPTRSDTDWPLQSQMARSWKFWI